MPDPDRRTISATQAAALWNVSPYVTRWMLHCHFAKNMPIDTTPDARMTWGSKLQPLIIEQAAADLALETRPNVSDEYQRSGLLGCTRDAIIICPDRGPGALETKCCFDYQTWMRDWDGGRCVPKHHEIQLQVQMLVGSGQDAPYDWGVIAAWVAGEVFYFERQPIPELWQRLRTEAATFFSDVQTGHEPNPFGAPIEIPWMRDLFPVTRGKVVDLRDDPAGSTLVDVAVQYRDAREQRSAAERICEPMRAKILAAARDANEVWLPSGVRIRLVTAGPHNAKRITVYVPPTAGEIGVGDLLNAG